MYSPLTLFKLLEKVSQYLLNNAFFPHGLKLKYFLEGMIIF